MRRNAILLLEIPGGIFHRLQLKEIAAYLDNRKKKDLMLFKAVVLAEMDGLRNPIIW